MNEIKSRVRTFNSYSRLAELFLNFYLTSEISHFIFLLIVTLRLCAFELRADYIQSLNLVLRGTQFCIIILIYNLIFLTIISILYKYKELLRKISYSEISRLSFPIIWDRYFINSTTEIRCNYSSQQAINAKKDIFFSRCVIKSK